MDIRRKGKVEKAMEFVERMRKVQEEAGATLRKAQSIFKNNKYHVPFFSLLINLNLYCTHYLQPSGTSTFEKYDYMMNRLDATLSIEAKVDHPHSTNFHSFEVNP